MKKELTLFILIPLTFNLLFFALYFSGIDSLQQIVGTTGNILIRYGKLLL